MDKKYYTVAEFAKKVGKTRQTIYKKTMTDLVNFCKEIDGQKMISYKALSKFNVKKLQDFTKEITVAGDSNLTDLVNFFNTQLSEQHSQIAKCYEQLHEKDLQLARKDEQIEKLQEQLTELTKAFREAQALHAGTMQRELSDNTTANDKHRWWKFWQKGK